MIGLDAPLKGLIKVHFVRRHEVDAVCYLFLASMRRRLPDIRAMENRLKSR